MGILRFMSHSKYFLSVFYMPITVPFARGVVVSKKDLILILMGLKI